LDLSPLSLLASVDAQAGIVAIGKHLLPEDEFQLRDDLAGGLELCPCDLDIDVWSAVLQAKNEDDRIGLRECIRPLLE
jgi:hypothetical protein